MKHPLLLPAVCHASGIVVAWYSSFSLSAIWGLTLLNLAAVMLVTCQRAALLVALCFSFGWLQTALNCTPHSPRDLRLQVGDQPTLAILKGRIVRSPQLSAPQMNVTTPVRWRVPVRVESIKSFGDPNSETPALGRVLVFSEGSFHTNLTTGTLIQVLGVVSRPPPAKAPGIFDYREKLRREGIHYQLKTSVESDWKILKQPNQPPLQDRFQHWARGQFAAGLPDEDESLRLLWAMVLGWRTALTDEVAEPFMRSGTMHIFAISGLHIALISGILIALLRVMRVGQTWCGAIVIPVLWFYCAATGFQASATRATLMMSIIIGGWALRRPTDLLNSTCAAALIILLWNPLQLMLAGFQLSFTVVLTIALLYPRFSAWGNRVIQLDPLRPEAEALHWQKFAVWASRQAFSLLAISFTAWIGSMPLIACYFHLWTPGALLANPLIVLLATAAIGSAIGGLLTSLFCSPISELFNHSAWWWITSQAWLSERTSELPGSWWLVPELSLPEIILYYLLIVGWGRGWCRRSTFSMGFYGLVTALAITATLQRIAWFNRTDLIVFGHNSNAVFWNSPGSQNDLLVDCGRAEAFKQAIRPYLESQGIDRLSKILLTHGDINHIEAFDLARESLQLSTVVTSPVPQRSPKYRYIQELLETHAPDRPRKRMVATGHEIEDWTVLHPLPGQKIQRADDAVVALITETHGWRVMLLSDGGPTVQTRLLNSGQDLSADVIVLGMADPSALFTEEFLRATNPQLVVIQDNFRPVQDRLERRHRQMLRNRGITSLPISESGTVEIRFDSAHVAITPTVGKSLRILRIRFKSNREEP